MGVRGTGSLDLRMALATHVAWRANHDAPIVYTVREVIGATITRYCRTVRSRSSSASR